jgi:hypothetical protein
MSVGTYKDALKLANRILEAADSPCGCVSLFSESTSTTIRFGECTPRCNMFVGCPRSSHQQEHCDKAECNNHKEDTRNYQ